MSLFRPLRHCAPSTPLLVAFPLLVALTIGCAGEGPVPEADAGSERALAHGRIVGFSTPDHDAHAWKGVPFAEPPVGPLRWRAPRLPASWTGLRPALTSAAECVQYDVTDPGEITGDEDCLYLDVYAPRFARDAIPNGSERRPVMVWIHGGGNSIGGAKIYDATRLAAEQDVVVVVLQYRLGVLGWLSHPALRATAENFDDASGNFGTLDTIRALEWVRENAAAFGGDPDNVTIFGESAGGINVFALLISPRAKGLFQRAISQSGVLLSTTRTQAEAFLDATPPGQFSSSGELLLGLLVADGRAADREAAKPVLAAMTPDEVEGYLRSKRAEELLALFDGEEMAGMYFVPMLVRDGRVIVDTDPLDALADPRLHNAVPTIVGTNREETKLFSLFTSPHVRHLFGLPMSLRDEAAFDLDGEYGGLQWKVQGADQPAEAMVSSGRTDVYGYRFDWDEEGELLWLDLDRMLGASHAVEILFVFGFTDLGYWTDNVFADPQSARHLSDQMQSYWAHFAKTGAPGAGTQGDLPEWKPWSGSPDYPKYMIFDSEAGKGLRMENAIHDRVSFLARLESDDRFATMRQRCQTLRDLVQFGNVYDETHYRAFAKGACRDVVLPDFEPLRGRPRPDYS